MLIRSARLAMSTSVLKALPGKLDMKRHSPSIFFLRCIECLSFKTKTTGAEVNKINILPNPNNCIIKMFLQIQ